MGCVSSSPPVRRHLVPKESTVCLVGDEAPSLTARSVKIVLEDPFIRESFRQYLATNYAEDVLRFWKDLETLKNLADGDAQMNPLVLLMCQDYLGNTQMCKQLRATSADVERTLKLCQYSEGAVSEKDPHTLRNAFNEVWQRVHDQLRIEYVPKFLVSQAFKETRAQFEGWAGEGVVDAVAASVAAMKELDIEFIMKEPFALDCFERFLRVTQIEGSMEEGIAADYSWTLACLLQEIQSYKSDFADSTEMFKRSQRIYMRYAGVTLEGDPKATDVLSSDTAGMMKSGQLKNDRYIGGGRAGAGGEGGGF